MFCFNLGYYVMLESLRLLFMFNAFLKCKRDFVHGRVGSSHDLRTIFNVL
jgi:hypothetical protein